MQFYKYISDPTSLRNILSGEMKFTSPAELNDPSELFPKFSREEVLASLRDLRERGHNEAEVNDLKRQHALMRALIPFFWRADLPLTARDADRMINLPIYDNIELIEQLFVGMLDAMTETVAVACFSQRWDSLPMWAHYADRARGLVVAYTDLDALFPGGETGWLNCPKEVSYSRETEGISFYPNSYGAILFSKLNDWAYEAEVRISTELKRCTKLSSHGAVSYSRIVPVTHVSTVITGWRMPTTTVDQVLALLNNDACRHIEIKSIRIHRGQLSLQPLAR